MPVIVTEATYATLMCRDGWPAEETAHVQGDAMQGGASWWDQARDGRSSTAGASGTRCPGLTGIRTTAPVEQRQTGRGRARKGRGRGRKGRGKARKGPASSPGAACYDRLASRRHASRQARPRSTADAERVRAGPGRRLPGRGLDHERERGLASAPEAPSHRNARTRPSSQTIPYQPPSARRSWCSASPRSKTSNFRSVNASRNHCESSRPTPLLPVPPNGAN